MSESALVLDNSILSALQTAGWFDAPSVYAPDRRILISKLVWEHEFVPYHGDMSIPTWASVTESNLEEVRTHAVGQLSRPDWSCIALAEQISADSTVVTNDQTLREVATRREITAEWGTEFVIRTFKRCGITVSDFEGGVEAYLTDVPLPPDVADEVRSTEKDTSN